MNVSGSGRALAGRETVVVGSVEETAVCWDLRVMVVRRRRGTSRRMKSTGARRMGDIVFVVGVMFAWD